jgi:hypothetical protein
LQQCLTLALFIITESDIHNKRCVVHLTFLFQSLHGANFLREACRLGSKPAETSARSSRQLLQHLPVVDLGVGDVIRDGIMLGEAW